jgi:hypothetical protein
MNHQPTNRRTADDPTYVGGLFVTLQSLLDRIEALRRERTSLAGVVALHAKKNVMAGGH